MKVSAVHDRRRSLGAKLFLLGLPVLLLALVSIALMLWVSWQLDGGAAAVNEAGRMRMQAYRMSLSVSTGARDMLPRQVEEFERSLLLLRHGDAQRPLFVPWDDAISTRFEAVEKDWVRFRDTWAVGKASEKTAGIAAATARFAANIDSLAAAIEGHLSHWTALLHLLQMAMIALAVLGAAALLYMGYLLVLEPVGALARAIQRIQHGDFGVRIDHVGSDEFGTLAEGFNGMAEHLQSMYRGLEARVTEKTAELEEKRERLEALYDVTAFAARATTLEELASGFTRRVGQAARADGVALRWSDETNRRYLMLSSQGLPDAMTAGEHCVLAGDCHCGSQSIAQGARVVPLLPAPHEKPLPCAQAGFKTVVAAPIGLHDRLMGEVDLFYHASRVLTPAENSLLAAMTAHLAGAMENLRLNALEKEAAVSQERTLLARELHDSIAQSLAFLKIQVQLMRDALASGDAGRIERVLGEIDTGVRESYGDVRELLVHFRTRANAEDIEPALRTTLSKFEHQSGLKAVLQMQGHGIPLAPDLQVQVLHIVQEALSNVRKHARASQVWLTVQQQPVWRFEVRDDGIGFDGSPGAPNENHVGLRIMAERAERIGARLDIHSAPRGCTSVVLTLPGAGAAAAANAGERAETVD